MKEQKEILESGLSLGKDDHSLIRHRKSMEKDYGYFATVKMILEDNGIPVEYPKGFNYKVSNTQALGSWSESYKRKLIKVYTDTIVKQSGMSISPLVDELKVFEIVNKQDELKRLIENIWKVRMPRLHQSEELNQEFIRKFVMAYVYSDKAKKEAKRVWKCIEEMKHFGMNQSEIRKIFVSHGIGMDCYTLSTTAVEKQAKVQHDDPELSANVKGSVCNGFEMFVPKKKVSMGIPKRDNSLKGYYERGELNLLSPANRKEAIRLYGGGTFSKIANKVLDFS